MKQYGIGHRLAHLAALFIVLAALSPKAMAQATPAAQPVGTLSSANVIAIRKSVVPLYSTPILFYTRPTEREKVRLFEFDAFGPIEFAKAAFSAGFDQYSNSPPEWGKSWGGFGKRVGSDFGVQVITTSTRYGLAEIFREDTAYYRCECKGFLPRIGHALLSTITGRRGEDGHTIFSVPGLLSPYAGSMTSLAWYPNRFGPLDGFRMGNYNLLGQAAGNLALEFIYGGPHTFLGHHSASKLMGGTGAAPNP